MAKLRHLGRQVLCGLFGWLDSNGRSLDVAIAIFSKSRKFGRVVRHAPDWLTGLNVEVMKDRNRATICSNVNPVIAGECDSGLICVQRCFLLEIQSSELEGEAHSASVLAWNGNDDPLTRFPDS